MELASYIISEVTRYLRATLPRSLLFSIVLYLEYAPPTSRHLVHYFFEVDDATDIEHQVSPSPIPPAIVIGGGSANGLGIARNLGSQGIPVYCVTSNPQELTRFSHYCTYTAIVPGIERDSTVLQRVLTTLQPRCGSRGVLFPTTDPALLTVSTLLDDLDPYVTFLSAPEIIETCVNKSKFYASLVAHGIPHPTVLDPHLCDINDHLFRLHFPVYLRPTRSLLFSHQFGVKGFVAHTPTAVQRYLNLANQHHLDLVIQEIIPGPAEHGYTLRGCLDNHSRVITLMATQKLRQPSLFSNCTINRSVPLTWLDSTIPQFLSYLQRLRYRGLFGAEFKWDPRDAQMKLLEINARSLGGNLFGMVCGVNDVFAAYHVALNEPVTPVTTYALDVYKIDLLQDIPILLQRLLHGQFTGSDLYPYLRSNLGQIRWKGDPAPFRHALYQMLTFPKLRKLLHYIRH